MEKVIKAVLEWGSPNYLKNDANAFASLKKIMAMEKFPTSDDDINQFLVEQTLTYQKHIDHYWLLTDLMLDFKTTSQLYFLNLELTKHADYAGRQLDRQSHLRIHLILAVINYAKLVEIIDSYGKDRVDLNDPELFTKISKLKALIDKSGIYKYRSTYIAHAFVKERGSSFALHYKDGIELIKNIFSTFTEKDPAQLNLDGDVNDFFLKIYNEADKSSVVYLIHDLKEKIRSVKLHGYNIRR